VDVRQLTYFLAVVETMNFGRAAEQLHIAQPSLSQAIGTLERELGVPLFHRVGRGIVLSDAGAQLIEPARQVVRDWRPPGPRPGPPAGSSAAGSSSSRCPARAWSRWPLSSATSPPPTRR
jgi:Bacterial regulatory helix-turn-helix protein, lysR family